LRYKIFWYEVIGKEFSTFTQRQTETLTHTQQV